MKSMVILSTITFGFSMRTTKQESNELTVDGTEKEKAREREQKKGFMVNHIKISEHERALGLIENENFGKI